MDKKIVSDAVVYSFYRYSSLFLVILTTTIVLKYLAVSVFGIYSVLILVFEYVRLVYRPSLAAGQKKIPLLRGQGKDSYIQNVRNRTFAPTFYLVLLISLTIFVSSFFLSLPQNQITGLRFGSIIILLQHFNFFHTNFLRADKRFGKLGMVELLLNSSRLVLTWLFIGMGLNGVLLAFVISYIISISIGLLIAPYRFSFSLGDISMESFKLTWKFGMAPALVFIVSTAFITVDRWVIVKFFDSTTLGYYGFAIFIITLVGVVPQIIGGVMFPRQVEAYGRCSDVKKLRPYLVFPVKVIAYSVPLLIAGAYIFVEFFILMFAAKYLPALQFVYILILASFFSSAVDPIINFLISINQEKLFMIVRSVMLVIALVLNIVLVSMGYGIKGVALATLIAFMIEFILLSYLSMQVTKATRLSSFKSTVSNLVPFIYMAMVLIIVNLVQINIELNFTSFSLLVIRYAAYLILSLPVIIYFVISNGLIEIFKKEYLPGFRRSASKLHQTGRL